MDKLREEWEHLYRDVRPKLLEEIAAAAAQGDRSENAEYIYGKKKLREIDKRLRILDGKIQNSKVVDPASLRTDRVAFGATVRLRKADGKEWRVRIVGADEIDPVDGLISMDSPVGKALMGRQAKERVEVQTPRGIMIYEILSIEFA
jgi:transcription elongation factor GreB